MLMKMKTDERKQDIGQRDVPNTSKYNCILRNHKQHYRPLNKEIHSKEDKRWKINMCS